MNLIKRIREAVSRKHPCHNVHKELDKLEKQITDIALAWNELPDDIRLDNQLNKLGEMVYKIGD